MSSSIFGVMDMAMVGIPVVAFCIWQLISVNREIAKDKAAKDSSPERTSPERTGHAVGEHRLDDR